MTDWTPEWVAAMPGLNRIPIKNTAKDEFVHRLTTYMRDRHDYGWSARTIYLESLGRVDECCLNPTDSRGRPRLWIMSGDGFLRLALAGRGERLDEDELVWREAVDHSLATLGKNIQVEWLAILTESKADSAQGRRLRQPVRVAGVDFGLVTSCVSEDASTTLNGTGVMVSPWFHWPIKVTGRTACYAWDSDGDWKTTERLSTLTALLSLAWDSHWKIREGPRESAVRWNDEGVLMGKGWQEVADDHPFADGRDGMEAPDWLGEAEAAVNRRRRSRDALMMHYQGLSLCVSHPSIALVCFTASIETIAQLDKDPLRCPECDSVTGSRDRFEDAVRPVLRPDQVMALTDAYSKRSRTVHQGRLHGAETRMGGWGPMSLFLPDPIFDFERGTVYSARQASRRLVLNALGVVGA
jgi:hypothetical protein